MTLLIEWPLVVSVSNESLTAGSNTMKGDGFKQEAREELTKPSVWKLIEVPHKPYWSLLREAFPNDPFL